MFQIISFLEDQISATKTHCSRTPYPFLLWCLTLSPISPWIQVSRSPILSLNSSRTFYPLPMWFLTFQMSYFLLGLHNLFLLGLCYYFPTQTMFCKSFSQATKGLRISAYKYKYQPHHSLTIPYHQITYIHPPPQFTTHSSTQPLLCRN